MFSQARSCKPSSRPQVWGAAARAAVVALAGLLVSCIDGREEYWIAGNGSGRAEIQYSVPSSIAQTEGGDEGIRKTLEDFFKETPAIKHGVCEVATADGRTCVNLRFEFDSGMELAEISDSAGVERLPTAVRHLAGKMNARVDGRTLQVTRTSTPDKAIPAASLLPPSQFEDRKLVCIVHLPTPAEESNATRVEDGGRTLCWETPLGETLNHPLMMHFTMELPLPWGKVLGGIVILLAAVIFGLRWLKPRRESKPAAIATPEK